MEEEKQFCKRRIFATFRPQNEHCHYIHGAERTFDVTEQILAMGKEAALAIEDHTESADMLYYGQDAFEWDNPFEVEVEEAVRAYFAENARYCVRRPGETAWAENLSYEDAQVALERATRMYGSGHAIFKQ